ncbi:Serine/threonine-protein kinase SKY1 [Fusarium odoratissimum]|uniref:non-specific serine/threonine protein kinase n=1 Tax=Fusarium oxysporum f. sp. cubense (strain race 4) TaxID=2502994 RepID=N1RKD6_FUSC4|nr:Serine/threonine-protein kinase SKY1 [Fusarium odoratissimum]
MVSANLLRAARIRISVPSIAVAFFPTHVRQYHGSQTPAQEYRCGVDAEPMHRYRPGGYHPVALGDSLSDGRYKVLHKLGWGSYSTTWAAKDQTHDRYVALKITVAEARSRDTKILQRLAASPRNHEGSCYVNQMWDQFTLIGPNGSHDCLVLDLVGPNIADIIDSHCRGDRLPSHAAKSISRQVLQGIDYLASNGIGHGDLHTRNIALEIPELHLLSERDFIARLGEPEMGLVTRRDGKSLSSNIPTCIVRPSSFRHKDVQRLLSSPSIKIIDFGEAFFNHDTLNTLHTPLPMFELVTGQPPFDVVMLTPPMLVQQMIELIDDELPSRWQVKWKEMKGEGLQQQDAWKLQSWMEEVYFDNNKHLEFTRDELRAIAKLIARLMRFEPSTRATPSELLADPWFQ